MIFVDASVVVAVLGREPASARFIEILRQDELRFAASPIVRFESVMALARLKSGPPRPTPDLLLAAASAVDAFLEDLRVVEIEITPEIGTLAVTAAARFGKAVGQQADLNMGDCYAYACAKSLGASLLYKGLDFAATDLA